MKHDTLSAFLYFFILIYDIIDVFLLWPNICVQTVQGKAAFG